MDWAVYAVQWLHVSAAVLWLGSALTLNLVIVPAVLKLPPGKQREYGLFLSTALPRMITPFTYATIVLGLLRGTVFGRIDSLDALTTPYGLAFAASLVLAIVSIVVITRLFEPVAARLYANGAAWAPAEARAPSQRTRRPTWRASACSSCWTC